MIKPWEEDKEDKNVSFKRNTDTDHRFLQVTHQSSVESCLSLRLGGFFSLPHHHTGAFVVQNITVLTRN